ncbi:MAG TPA: acyl-CoA dehydrogenase family protein, partial [Thermoleophilaceae bacterium]|nr:acyl-CoA dehydrogenase family protein [Thermoleophilaceae bacterium]
QANRALQLAGGEGYLRGHPYEKALRDIRVFPIFEGANDVLRAYIALSGLKALGEEVGALRDIDLSEPIHSLGVLAEYVGARIRRDLRPDRLTRAHPELQALTDPVSDQVKRLRQVAESVLRANGRDVVERQFLQKRLADAAADIYAQVAVLSRVTSILEEQDVRLSGQELHIAETFCRRAAGRVSSNFDQIEHNDDDRMVALAGLAYRRGAYGYALFED